MSSRGSFRDRFSRIGAQWRRASLRRKIVTLVISATAIVLTVRAIVGSSGGGTPFGNELVFRLIQLGGTVLLIVLARRSLRR
jgi:hypothetical protein